MLTSSMGDDGDTHYVTRSAPCRLRLRRLIGPWCLITLWNLAACARTDFWVQDSVQSEATVYALGDSEFGPWTERTAWGSASGGGISNTFHHSAMANIASTQTGRTVVVWAEGPFGEDGSNIVARQFDGDAWVEIGAGSATAGGISNTAGKSADPVVVLDGAGRLVVAWQQNAADGTKDIFVRRQADTGQWLEVSPGSASSGGVNNSVGNASEPSLSTDATGDVVVAWVQHNGTNSDVYVRRLVGGAWQEVGPSSAIGGGISNTAGDVQSPSIHRDGAGRLVVAWQDDSDGVAQIYVRRQNISTWDEVGPSSASGSGVSATTTESSEPSLLIDDADTLVLVWLEYGGTLASSGIYVRRFVAGSWQEMGTGSATDGGISGGSNWTSKPSVARDGEGTVFIAWPHGGGSHSAIYVQRFDGTAWQEASPGAASGAGISNTGGDTNGVRLFADAGGQIVAAWTDTSGANLEIFARRLSNGSWLEMGQAPYVGGGISATEGTSRHPALGISADGDLVVAWDDGPQATRQIYARSFDGENWRELGPGSASGYGVSDRADPASYGSQYPSIVSDRQGRIVVAWQEIIAIVWQAYARGFDGSSWAELSAGSASGGGISNLSRGDILGLTAGRDANGDVVLVWSERDPGSAAQIQAHRLVNGAWQVLGSSVESAESIDAESLSPVVGSHPALGVLVAWAESRGGYSEIYARHYMASQWSALGPGADTGGGISGSSGVSRTPTLVVDDSGGVVIAWADDTSGRNQIYVRRFDGSAWTELGSGSTSGGGISNTPGDSTAPQLALDGTGQPVAVWQHASSTSSEIYARRFSDPAWIEVAQGTASGGGVSNSAASSLDPAVALYGEALCIAWSEAGMSSTEIVLRCTER